MAERKWTKLKLPCDSLVVDDGILPRQPAQALVDHYAEVQRRFDFPPVLVVHEGETNWLCDGRARLRAAEKLEQAEIMCQVTAGTREDAVWIASGANRKHGMPLTNAEKSQAVENLLRCPEWAKRSDTDIADHVGCSHPTVGKVRKKLFAAEPELEPETKVVKSPTGSGELVELPVAPKPKKAKPGTAKKKMERDQFTTPVADFVRPAWEGSVTLDSLCTALGEWFKQVEQAKTLESGAGQFLDLEDIALQVQELRKTIQAARLHGLCVECAARGQPVKTCRCEGRGWYTRDGYNQHVLNIS